MLGLKLHNRWKDTTFLVLPQFSVTKTSLTFWSCFRKTRTLSDCEKVEWKEMRFWSYLAVVAPTVLYDRSELWECFVCGDLLWQFFGQLVDFFNVKSLLATRSKLIRDLVWPTTENRKYSSQQNETLSRSNILQCYWLTTEKSSEQLAKYDMK